MVNRIEIPESREDLITKTKVALWAAPLWGSTVTGQHEFYRVANWLNYPDQGLTVYTKGNAKINLGGGHFVALGITADRTLVAFSQDWWYSSSPWYYQTIELKSLSSQDLKTIIRAFSAKQRPEHIRNRRRHGRRRRRRYDTPAA